MTMIGFLLSIVKNLFFIGFSIVESVVFMIAFNYMAPFVHAEMYELPVVNLTYLQCLALFILIHFVGRFVNTLFPTIISIKNRNSTKE